jgi:hypothetical protein
VSTHIRATSSKAWRDTETDGDNVVVALRGADGHWFYARMFPDDARMLRRELDLVAGRELGAA